MCVCVCVWVNIKLWQKKSVGVKTDTHTRKEADRQTCVRVRVCARGGGSVRNERAM